MLKNSILISIVFTLLVGCGSDESTTITNLSSIVDTSREKAPFINWPYAPFKSNNSW